MINTNELRKGNLVYAQDCGISEVLEVYKDSVKLIDGDIWHESSIDPIPLTEEWLFRFSFQYRFRFYYKNKIKLDFSTTGIIRFHWNKKITYLDYVHNLQNLYYALKEEELAIK